VIEVIGLAVVLFVSTNIDDIFVLITFYADHRFAIRQIVFGQYLGLYALVLISVVASLVSLLLPKEQVGLLGVLPVLIGARKLVALWRANKEGKTSGTNQARAVLTVTTVTVANGGDNIGVYTPVFATRPFPDLVVIGVVFAAMTALWLAVAYWLVNLPQVGAPIRRYGSWVAPVILIGLGAMILYKAGSIHVIEHLAGSALSGRS
jgi:cadmium resistance protein CadD (predicted permease)